jgi:hypothetical protein
MQEALTPTLEQVMKNTAPHLFVFTISLLLATMLFIVLLGRDAWNAFSSHE